MTTRVALNHYKLCKSQRQLGVVMPLRRDTKWNLPGFSAVTSLKDKGHVVIVAHNSSIHNNSELSLSSL